jgi:hypothetical protein
MTSSTPTPSSSSVPVVWQLQRLPPLRDGDDVSPFNLPCHNNQPGSNDGPAKVIIGRLSTLAASDFLCSGSG